MGAGDDLENRRFQDFLKVFLFNIVLTAGTGAVTFINVWPNHHGAAIALIALILSVSASFFILTASRHAIGWALATSYVIICAGASIYSHIGGALPTETEAHGWLRPANDKSIPTMCDRFYGKDATTLFMGNDIIPMPKSVKRSVILQYDNRPVLVIHRRDDGSIAVDADLYDRDGKIAVHMVANEFKLIQGQYSYTKRPDRNTLTVMDLENNPMLYIHYANANMIEMAGHFFLSKRHEIYFGPNGSVLNYWQDGKVIGAMRTNEPSCGEHITVTHDGMMSLG